jgi:hypothetical protein
VYGTHSLVLAIQDTTFLNYTHHPATTGLGPIGHGQQGLVMHTTMTFTPQGLPLGILEQRIWARLTSRRHVVVARVRSLRKKARSGWPPCVRP